jgi:MFS family permease
VCGCLSLAVIGLAPNLQVVLLGWCLAQLAYNAALAAIVAIVPDHIPAQQRGTVVGILGICMPIGQIAATYLVQELSFSTIAMLVVPGLVGVLGVTVLALVLHEPSPPAATLPSDAPPPDGMPSPDAASPPDAPPPPGATIAVHQQPQIARQPHDRRDFAWTWLSRVMFTVGSCFLQAYQPFFLLDKLHNEVADVPRLIFRSTLVSAAMVVIWSLLAGKLSDRSGARKPFVMAGSVVQGMGL